MTPKFYDHNWRPVFSLGRPKDNEPCTIIDEKISTSKRAERAINIKTQIQYSGFWYYLKMAKHVFLYQLLTEIITFFARVRDKI